MRVVEPPVPLRTLTLADSVKLGSQIANVGRRVTREAGHALAIVIVVDEDGTPHLDLLGRNPMRLDIFDLARYTRAAITAMGDATRKAITNEEAMKAEWDRLMALDERFAHEARAKSAAVPWKCEHCGKGYKTHRGAEQHERTCLTQPRNADHHWALCRAAGVDNRIYTCKCGWENAPMPHRQAAIATREHFDAHQQRPTEPGTLFHAPSTAS